MMHVLAIFATVFLSAHALFKNEPHITKLRKEHKHHHSVWEFVEKDENHTNLPVIHGRSIGTVGGSMEDPPKNESNNVTIKIGHKRFKISEAKLAALKVHDLEELEKLQQKLEKLNKHFANYSNLEINETLVKQYKEHRSGKVHIIHGRGVHHGHIKLGRGLGMTGRGVPSSVGHSAGAGNDEKSNETANEGGLGIGDEEMDAVEEFKKYPVREWGDECTIGETDECHDYTTSAYPGNNSKHLSCDTHDRICLCLENDRNVRAEYSKEKEICLLPRYYICENTNQCAPLHTCEPATTRDYANDPLIRAGNPKICRLKVKLNNVADHRKVPHRIWLAYFLLIIMMQLQILTVRKVSF